MPARTCSVCQAVHHEDCWTGHGKCSGCGFGETGRARSAGFERRLPTGLRRYQLQQVAPTLRKKALGALLACVLLFATVMVAGVSSVIFESVTTAPLPILGTLSALALLAAGTQFLLMHHRATSLLNSLRPPPLSGNEERLAVGKQTLRARHVESVVVPADLPLRVPIQPLKVGQDYVLEASGVITVWEHVEDGVDAVYCYAPWRVKNPPEVWFPLAEESGPFAKLGGGPHLEYDPSHVYRVRVTGQGGPLVFRVGDAVDNNSYSSNRGEFIVRVLEVVEEA